MKIPTLDNLERQILEYGFCTVLEVTNGINKPQLKIKATQAVRGKDFLSGMVKAEVPIYAGIMYFQTKNVHECKREGIDLFSEIKGYEKVRALDALDRLSRKKKYKKWNTLVQNLTALVGEGYKLQDILYPHKSEEYWKGFSRQFPQLANRRTRENYVKYIAEVKGGVLEIYTQLLCRDAIPGSIVHRALKYETPLESRPEIDVIRDIDIIIIGEQKRVLEGLANPRYFTPKPIIKEKAYSSSLVTSSS